MSFIPLKLMELFRCWYELELSGSITIHFRNGRVMEWEKREIDHP